MHKIYHLQSKIKIWLNTTYYRLLSNLKPYLSAYQTCIYQFVGLSVPFSIHIFRTHASISLQIPPLRKVVSIKPLPFISHSLPINNTQQTTLDNTYIVCLCRLFLDEINAFKYPLIYLILQYVYFMMAHSTCLYTVVFIGIILSVLYFMP